MNLMLNNCTITEHNQHVPVFVTFVTSKLNVISLEPYRKFRSGNNCLSFLKINSWENENIIIVGNLCL